MKLFLKLVEKRAFINVVKTENYHKHRTVF